MFSTFLLDCIPIISWHRLLVKNFSATFLRLFFKVPHMAPSVRILFYPQPVNLFASNHYSSCTFLNFGNCAKIAADKFRDKYLQCTLCHSVNMGNDKGISHFFVSDNIHGINSFLHLVTIL